MMTETLKCERHGETTRLTCVDCEQAICPKCMVRTEVGLKCERCAQPVATPDVVLGGRPSRLPLVAGLVGLALVALVAFLVLRPSDSPEELVAALPPVGTWTEAAGLTTIICAPTANTTASAPTRQLDPHASRPPCRGAPDSVRRS